MTTEPKHTVRSQIDITPTIHAMCRAFCTAEGIDGESRDGYGRYRWEAYIDTMRAVFAAIRQHEAEQQNAILTAYEGLKEAALGVLFGVSPNGFDTSKSVIETWRITQLGHAMRRLNEKRE